MILPGRNLAFVGHFPGGLVSLCAEGKTDVSNRFSTSNIKSHFMILFHRQTEKEILGCLTRPALCTLERNGRSRAALSTLPVKGQVVYVLGFRDHLQNT